MDPVLPQLDGASVAGLVPALVGGHPAPWIPDVVEHASSVVLLVLDGLGFDALGRHPDRLATIGAMSGGPITTVVPSTTASALTSIATGLAPAQHGIVGFRMLIDGSVLNVLGWHSDGARVPDPFDVQRHTAFLGRPVPVVTKREFRDSGFSNAHLRGARFIGWRTTAVLVEHCRRLVAEGERFVYAYYPGVDTVAHEFGLHDEFYARELAAADRLVGDLLETLPSSCALLVTSDHGQVHLDADDWLDLPELAPLVTAMAGDGRFRYLHARPGGARELVAAAREVVGGRAWVRSRKEVLDEGWLGTGATGTVPGRIGDVVLAATGTAAFVDPALPFERKLRSAHGSLTPDEMYVPLVAALGTGPG
ncbi:MAG TPA: alkaline phosphatase family protein [Acidimicrobiia bacterium]|nr:alkaline phosphatase family protein [Acidimicrobiia bacterium]